MLTRLAHDWRPSLTQSAVDAELPVAYPEWECEWLDDPKRQKGPIRQHEPLSPKNHVH